ncbi:hypothetical protein Tco_0611704 [Tanacetum coccineum]
MTDEIRRAFATTTKENPSSRLKAIWHRMGSMKALVEFLCICGIVLLTGGIASCMHVSPILVVVVISGTCTAGRWIWLSRWERECMKNDIQVMHEGNETRWKSEPIRKTQHVMHVGNDQWVITLGGEESNEHAKVSVGKKRHVMHVGNTSSRHEEDDEKPVSSYNYNTHQWVIASGGEESNGHEGERERLI